MTITFMTPHYINPYTDFIFKKLFGTTMNKHLLIGCLIYQKRNSITFTR